MFVPNWEDELRRDYEAWEQSHGPLFDLGAEALVSGDQDTFILAQLLLVNLPPKDDNE